MVAKKKRSNKWQIIAAMTIIIIAAYVTYSIFDGEVYAVQPAPEMQSGISKDASAGSRFTSTVSALELPAFDSDRFVINNAEGRYTLLYDTLYRQASWVAYVLTSGDVEAKSVKRGNKFIPDPKVVSMGYPTAKTGYYTSSGYDRGHLCPSADRAGSREENGCTFMLSNISPQTPALNRGVWKNLEEQARRWAVQFDTLYIITGGVLTPGLKRISGGVGVPEYFYKAFLTSIDGEYRAIAFIIPNAESYSGGWERYAVSVDSLEKTTALDLFQNLPDDIENKVESDTAFSFWLSESEYRK